MRGGCIFFLYPFNPTFFGKTLGCPLGVTLYWRGMETSGQRGSSLKCPNKNWKKWFTVRKKYFFLNCIYYQTTSWVLSKCLSLQNTILSRPGQSHELLFKHLCNSLINSVMICENIFTMPPRPNGCIWCFQS